MLDLLVPINLVHNNNSQNNKSNQLKLSKNLNNNNSNLNSRAREEVLGQEDCTKDCKIKRIIEMS